MSEPYWAVTQCQTNRSDLVALLLKRKGFTVYAPKVRIEKRTAPLFPGYLIVRIATRWYPVRWTPGVLRVLMHGDHPAKLDDAIVAELRGREVRGFVKLAEDPRALTPGRKVRVLTGNFAGQVGVYQGMSGAARERVLLEWLGQSVPVIMPVGNVEAVA